MANLIYQNADGSYTLPSTGYTWPAGTPQGAFGTDAVFQPPPAPTTTTTPTATTNTTPTPTPTPSPTPAPTADQQIQQTMTTNAAGNGTVPTNQTVTPQLLQNSTSQELGTQGLQPDPTTTVTPTTAGASTQVAAPTPTGPSSYEAQLTGYQNAIQGTAATVDPNTVGQTQAAQGTVDPNSLVQNQVKNIMSTADSSGIPDFAKATARGIQDQMAGRGLGASSLTAEATAFGVLQAVFPMAQFNAQIYADLNKINLNNQQQANILNSQQRFQATMQNLSNEQQMDLQNTQNRQQVLLTDQAAHNASLQFNAQNEQQNQQFQASLFSQIALNNAQRADALASFNAGQLNSVGQFNASLADSRDKFNVQNQQLIDQSNVNWRRNINTANTAALNAANQINAQNMFNMTQQAQTNLWQQWRDEASWANLDSENALNRAQNLTIAAMQRDTYFQGLDYAQQSQLYSSLGNFAVNLLGTQFKSTQTPTTQTTSNVPIPQSKPPVPDNPVDQSPFIDTGTDNGGNP